jgi:cell division protein FtsW
MPAYEVNEKPRKIDSVLVILALVLTCFGIWLVFDASMNYLLQIHASPYKYVIQQSIWGVLGLGAMSAAVWLPYWRWREVAVYMVLIAWVLLLCVFIPHIGIKANGAHRWIGHGSLRLQPSEFAKLALLLYVSHVCAGRFKKMRNFTSGALPPLVVIGMIGVLVAIEPDLGTTIVLVLTGLGILFFSGMRMRHFAGTLGALLVLASLFVGFKVLRAHSGDHSAGNSFQLQRLMVFLHPEQDKEGDGYQVYHSTVALGSGGLFGIGIGEGREKMYLPEAHTDFIFSVLGEEGGFVAGALLLGLFIALVGRGMHIAANSRDAFGSLLAAGISLSFGLQVLINVGVVTSSIPATGVPLPFNSYGGSSLFISLLMVGILLSIARHPDGDPAKARKRVGLIAEMQFDERRNRGASLSRPEYRRGLYSESPRETVLPRQR